MRSRRSTRVAGGLAVMGVIAVLVSGCGGTKTLSHQALVTKADAVCQKANSQVSKLGAPIASLSALTGYATKVLPISQQLVSNLSALNPSSGDQSSLNTLVAALKNGNKGLKMMETASTSTQASQASAVIVSQSVPSAANKLGAATCAASPSA